MTQNASTFLKGLEFKVTNAQHISRLQVMTGAGLGETLTTAIPSQSDGPDNP